MIEYDRSTQMYNVVMGYLKDRLIREDGTYPTYDELGELALSNYGIVLVPAPKPSETSTRLMYLPIWNSVIVPDDVAATIILSQNGKLTYDVRDISLYYVPYIPLQLVKTINEDFDGLLHQPNIQDISENNDDIE